MSAHTPGQWEVLLGYTVEYPGQEFFAVGIPGKPWTVVALLSPADAVTDRDRSNARLIAASKDLLAALRNMLNHFGKPRRDEWMNDDAWQEAINADSQARAAIARATGSPA